MRRLEGAKIVASLTALVGLAVALSLTALEGLASVSGTVVGSNYLTRSAWIVALVGVAAFLVIWILERQTTQAVV